MTTLLMGRQKGCEKSALVVVAAFSLLFFQTHLPYEPLGSIKARERVIIQKRAVTHPSLAAHTNRGTG